LPVVLIADDEPAVLEVVRAMARSLGWRTLLADNGAQALAILREDHGTIDRVLLDLHMPRVDGRSVLETIRTEHSGMPVVIMTGDCDAREAGLVPDDCELLAKPFEFAQLKSALHRECLAREVA
jgi:CheY-like chemotaxis protein